LELGITCWLVAKVEEEGSTTVPSRTFTDLVSTMPPEQADMFLDENTQTLNVKCGSLNTDIKCIERRLQEGTAFGDVVAQNIVCSLQAFGYIANRYKGKKVFDTVIAALKQIIKEKVKLTDQQTTWMTKLSFAEFYESIAELFKLQLDAGYPLNVTDLDKYISMTNQYITEVSFSHQVMETPETR